MPRRARRIERPARHARMKRALRRLEPHIMAHPDIMDDIAAIAELHHLPHQPRRGEMIAIVIAACDPKAVLGHHHIADREHRSRPRAGDLAHLGPALRSEEHTSELQSLMRTSYAAFFLKKQKNLQN